MDRPPAPSDPPRQWHGGQVILGALAVLATAGFLAWAAVRAASRPPEKSWEARPGGLWPDAGGPRAQPPDGGVDAGR